ncbi:hypothetical protein [Streptomyces sp. LUP30]|uniref:hypothetical protein n=2 Tax=unclassified Streptomyces TaxID=2593676 RepID=UPI0008516C1B|nr:hypothetical protein [Streptomyces sp. LUP30]
MNVLLFLFADLTPVSAVFGAVGAYAAGCSLLYLTCDADLADFDPRPAVRRVVDAGRLDAVLVRVANARFDVRELAAETRLYAALSLRDTAITATALLALLVPAPSESVR